MMHQSSDILILYDVPSSHAVEHRTMSLLLEKSASRTIQEKRSHFLRQKTKTKKDFFRQKEARKRV